MATLFPPIPGSLGSTVLKYLKLDLQGNWDLAVGSPSYAYVPSGPTGHTANLYVLTEEPDGSLVSYRFVVKRPVDRPNYGFGYLNVVQVLTTDNTVYIPTRCADRYAGDPTACG
jgi:hypothetical protein